MFLEVPCRQESSTKAFAPIMATGAKPQLCLRPEPAGFMQDSGCCVHTRALSTTSEAGAVCSQQYRCRRLPSNLCAYVKRRQLRDPCRKDAKVIVEQGSGGRTCPHWNLAFLCGLWDTYLTSLSWFSRLSSAELQPPFSGESAGIMDAEVLPHGRPA